MKRLERVKGIEPSYSAWKAAALPLSYTRFFRSAHSFDRRRSGRFSRSCDCGGAQFRRGDASNSTLGSKPSARRARPFPRRAAPLPGGALAVTRRRAAARTRATPPFREPRPLSPVPAAIEARPLAKHFGATTAVDAISFAIAAGSVTGLLGGNGAGKTTTIGMILGLIAPTSGAVSVFGVDMARDRYRVLGRMNFESPYVDMPHRLTVRQNLRVFGRLYGVENFSRRIDELAESLALGVFARSARRQPLGRAEDARRAGQGADQRARTPAARRADRFTRSGRRGLGSLAPRGLSGQAGRDDPARLAQHGRGRAPVRARHHAERGRIVDDGSPRDLIARYGRESLEEVFLNVARGAEWRERSA